MELQVCKWGNSLAVRLPLGLVAEFGIVEGSLLRAEMLGARLPGNGRKSSSQTSKALAVELRAMHANRPVTRAVTKEEMSRY
jgi:antitoxin component of MazEF toxin-antitoxin module